MATRSNRFHTSLRITLSLLGISIAGALTLGGCASSQHSTADTTFTHTNDGALVEVRLDEYKIHMPTSIPAGAITFQVENTGKHKHNIEIEGHGVEATLDYDLRPGETAELKVHLVPGTYKVYCPVGPHRMLGMRLELMVMR